MYLLRFVKKLIFLTVFLKRKQNLCVCPVEKCLEKNNKSKYISMSIMETTFTIVGSVKKYLPIITLLRNM